MNVCLCACVIIINKCQESKACYVAFSVCLITRIIIQVLYYMWSKSTHDTVGPVQRRQIVEGLDRPYYVSEKL